MAWKDDIVRSIKVISGEKTLNQYLKQGFVKNKNGDNTIDVISMDSVDYYDGTSINTADYEASYLNIRLTSKQSNGFVINPTDGSLVTINLYNPTDGFVVSYSDIDSMQFINNTNAGLVKVIQLTAKLNTLENNMNALIAAYNAHIHVDSVTAVPTLTTSVPDLGGPIPLTLQSDIENTKVAH
jgi:hypothetical protein